MPSGPLAAFHQTNWLNSTLIESLRKLTSIRQAVRAFPLGWIFVDPELDRLIPGFDREGVLPAFSALDRAIPSTPRKGLRGRESKAGLGLGLGRVQQGAIDVATPSRFAARASMRIRCSCVPPKKSLRSSCRSPSIRRRLSPKL